MFEKETVARYARPVREPHISLILVVKNGMPHLPAAVDSLRAQTLADFEVVVQDGGSSDGTLEFLDSVDDIPNWNVVSEPDGGIGDAYNRAFGRTSGAIVGSIDADNTLEPRALEKAASFLSQHPKLAAAYGGSNMLNAEGEVLYPWFPAEYDLLRLLTCELVPPFAVSFFSRAVSGDELRFDPSLKTCADYDLWLRLSHLPIARIPAILGGTRLSDASMTRRPETYGQYILDKSTALDRYLSRIPRSAVTDAVRAHALAGLYLWSAESVYDIEGRRSEQFESYVQEAAVLDPGSDRLARLKAKPDFDPVRFPTVEGERDIEPPPDPPQHRIRKLFRVGTSLRT